MDTALLLIDVQKGFDDPRRPSRNNCACDDNIARLIAHATRQSWALVVVRHDSVDPDSLLRPEMPGNALKPYVGVLTPDLTIVKSVHSAFGGDVDLNMWLRKRGISRLVICGMQTNLCCETTARQAGDLGYDVQFVIDATHTFDQVAYDGAITITAAELARVTATNLDGNFATVTTTEALLESTSVARAARRSGAEHARVEQGGGVKRVGDRLLGGQLTR